jgi:hypothetical protein
VVQAGLKHLKDMYNGRFYGSDTESLCFVTRDVSAFNKTEWPVFLTKNLTPLKQALGKLQKLYTDFHCTILLHKNLI